MWKPEIPKKSGKCMVTLLIYTYFFGWWRHIHDCPKALEWLLILALLTRVSGGSPTLWWALALGLTQLPKSLVGELGGPSSSFFMSSSVKVLPVREATSATPCASLAGKLLPQPVSVRTAPLVMFPAFSSCYGPLEGDGERSRRKWLFVDVSLAWPHYLLLSLPCFPKK